MKKHAHIGVIFAFLPRTGTARNALCWRLRPPDGLER
jgi:hypothetical protein